MPAPPAPVADPDTLRRWDADHLWHPFSSPEADSSDVMPIIVGAEGCWLVDIGGNRLLDGVSSLWCNLHGHRVPEIDAAISNQLAKIAHSTLLGASHPSAIELARRLVEIAPTGLTRVFFSDNGATAVEAALKMAFQYQLQRPDPKPGKTRFLSLRGAYHGDTLGAVGIGDLGLFHDRFGPLRVPALHACQPSCHRCPLGLARPACAIACASEAEKLIAGNADRLAAVVVEPGMQGAAGMIPLPEGYLRRLRDAATEHDVLLVADEVATGFHRCGPMFACQEEGVSPDLLCLAKGLTGGYLPLAATLATEQIHQAFRGPPEAGRGFYHGHTYTGNPLGAAAALANLDLLASPGFAAEVARKSAKLGRGLDSLTGLPGVAGVRHKGMMAGVDLSGHDGQFVLAGAAGRRVCRLAREMGVLLRPLGDTVVVMPPLAVTDDEIDILCLTLAESIRRHAAERPGAGS